MNTQAHIDETTGEQLASVYRNHSGKCQVRLIPWVLTLLRACARKDDTPPAITRARCAIVRIEPRARSPEGPWPGLLDAGPGLFDLSESGVRAFVAELQTAALPDAALPRPVYRLPINASQP